MKNNFRKVIEPLLVVACIGAAIFGVGVSTLEIRRRVLETSPIGILSAGPLPTDTPVMLFWIASDGVITACSAVKTSGEMVLPYSTTSQAVPYDQLEGWTCWATLEEIWR